MTVPVKKGLKKGSNRSEKPAAAKKSAKSDETNSQVKRLQDSFGNRFIEEHYKRSEKREYTGEGGQNGPKSGEAGSEKGTETVVKPELPVLKRAPAQKPQESKRVELTGSSEHIVARFAKASPSQIAATFPSLGKTLTSKLKTEREESAKSAPKLAASLRGETGSDKKLAEVSTAKKEILKDKNRGKDETPRLPEHRDFAPPPKNEKSLEKLSGKKSKNFLEWFKSHFSSFLNTIKTTDSGLNTKAGEVPKVVLKGTSDPVRSENDKQEAQNRVAEERDSAARLFAKHPGQSMIRAKSVEKEYGVTLPANSSESIETAEDEGMREYLEAEIPKSVRSRADELLKPSLENGLGRLKKEAKKAATERDKKRKREEQKKREEARALSSRAQKAQEEAVLSGRRNVAKEQSKGIEEAHKVTKEFSKEVQTEQHKVKKSISDKVKRAHSDAEKELKKGEAEAKRLKAKGEREAKRKKEELKEKQRKKSWWDRAVDAIKSAVKAITKAIDYIFTKIREAVKKAIDAAKKLAIAAINKARKFIVEKLEAFRKWAKKMVDKYLKRYFPALAKRINRAIDRFVDRAKNVVNRVADGLIAGVKALADALSKVLDKILSVFQTSLKAAVQIAGAVLTGDFAEALKVAIQAACDIAGVDSKPVFGFLKRAGALFLKILKSPRKFFNNLAKAVGGGVKNFAKNIKKHLINALFAWLTGVLSEAKIDLPEKFDAKGVFSLAVQILGLTYANIKARILKRYPKAGGIMDKLEKGFDVLKELVTKGPSALWGTVSSMLKGFRERIVEGVRNFVISTLVKEGILWLLSLLNPVSAIVKIIKLLYDFIMFLVESFDQIRSFVISVYNSIASIAAGALGPAKKAVENSLAKILPVAINLLARLAGLGGIAKTVRKIIAKVSRPVNRVIDKVVDKAVLFAKKLLKRGKKGLRKVKKRVEKVFKIDREIGRPVTFSAAKEHHRLWIARQKGRLVPMVASSNPTPMERLLNRWKRETKNLKGKERERVEALLKLAGNLLKDLENSAKREEGKQEVALKDKLVTKSEADAVKSAEKRTIADEVKLVATIEKLMSLFDGKDEAFEERFKTELERMHPLARRTLLDDIKRKSLAKETARKSGLKGFALKYSEKFKEVYAKPLLRRHLFGESLQKSEALSAFNLALKESEKKLQQEKISPSSFISHRISSIHKEEGEVAQNVYKELQRYIFEKSRKKDVVKVLKIFYISSLHAKSEKEHSEYKPDIPPDGIKLHDQIFEINYRYFGKKHEKKSFKVKFDFSSLDKHDEVTHIVEGENLTLKEPGSRGKTAGSGELKDKKYKGAEITDKNLFLKLEFLRKFVKKRFKAEKEEKLLRKIEEAKSEKELENIFKELGGQARSDFRNEWNSFKAEMKNLKGSQRFDSAHLIADWFGGSGYKKALNLVVTSAEYNRVIMAGAEKKIVDEVKSASENSLFDLKVAATWDVLKDSELKSKINKNSIFRQLDGSKEVRTTDERKKLAKGAQDKLFDILSSRQDPRRVLKVKYEGKVRIPEEKKLQKQQIGCDIWMSSFFKFDKREKCYL